MRPSTRQRFASPTSFAWLAALPLTAADDRLTPVALRQVELTASPREWEVTSDGPGAVGGPEFTLNHRAADAAVAVGIAEMPDTRFPLEHEAYWRDYIADMRERAKTIREIPLPTAFAAPDRFERHAGEASMTSPSAVVRLVSCTAARESTPVLVTVTLGVYFDQERYLPHVNPVLATLRWT